MNSDDRITIGICNFNTTKLTNACIGSIVKHVKQYSYQIIIFDNSTIDKFILDPKYQANDIVIMDNTTGKYIDFEKVIKPIKGFTINNYGNLKHTMSIQYLLDICLSKYFVLFDSDTLLKKDLDFIDDKYVTCANICPSHIVTDTRYSHTFVRHPRFEPFIQFFNISLIKKYGLRFLDFNRIIGSKYRYSQSFDTGSSFFIDIINRSLPYKRIENNDYIEHRVGSSWAKVNDDDDFLNVFSDLYR